MKIKKENIQPYYYIKSELFFFVILAIICFVIGLIRFGDFNELKYETTDPALHYKIARTFSEQDSLLDANNSIDELYTSFSHNMTGTYVNDGLLMKVLDFIPSYKVFMIFDVLCFALYGLLFYLTLSYLNKSGKHKFLLFIISILYVMGYPLNNMIFGFNYLGFGVFIVNLIMLTHFMMAEIETGNKLFIFILAILNFALFFTYYLFVPVLYLSQGLYIIYSYVKNKKKFKTLVIDFIIALIIPFLIGFAYLVLPGFLDNDGGNSVTALAAEGYIYRDLFSNFILLLPMLIYYFLHNFKKKLLYFDFLTFIIIIIYTLFVFVLGMKGLSSSYYYYKLYYLIWLMSWIAIGKSICCMRKSDYNMLYSWILTFLLILFIAGAKIESKIQSINLNFNPTIVANSLTNIYVWNANKVIQKNSIIDNEKIELIEKTVENKNLCLTNLEIPVIGNFLEKLWFYSITDIVPIYNHSKSDLSRFYDEEFDYKNWSNDSSQKCLLYFYSKDYEFDVSNYEIIYENSEGILIKK